MKDAGGASCCCGSPSASSPARSFTVEASSLDEVEGLKEAAAIDLLGMENTDFSLISLQI